jgi:threonine/homoserine/homoserine lactone efflux protein
MLFLLGVKAHPIVRVLLGAALIAVGVGLHLTVLTVAGVPMLAWGGYTWYRRSRPRGHGVGASKDGAAR